MALIGIIKKKKKKKSIEKFNFGMNKVNVKCDNDKRREDLKAYGLL